MTKLQIIEELFDNGYVKDPETRSIADNGGCLYQHPDGRKCAVGKCMTKDALEEYGDRIISVDGLHDEVKGIDKILQENYRGHDIGFWTDLQCLHDDVSEVNFADYWDSNDLTKVGENRLEELKKMYS